MKSICSRAECAVVVVSALGLCYGWVPPEPPLHERTSQSPGQPAAGPAPHAGTSSESIPLVQAGNKG